MGIGYFYKNLSDDFRALFNNLNLHRSIVQRGEVYYNAQVTSSSYLTFSPHVIGPINASRDMAIVPGLRYRIDV